MRIGRNLTVTEIDNRITNYIQNYELSEAQINALLANYDGAIGCLAQLVGVSGRRVPICILEGSAQSLNNESLTNLAFDTELLDNLGMWAIGAPTELYIPFSGQYHITAGVYFASNAVGDRRIEMGGDFLHSLVVFKSAAVGGNNTLILSGDVHALGEGKMYLKAWQSSTGALNATPLFIYVHRRSLQSYLGE